MITMEWKTKITEMIGCKYPILLGAFAGFDNKELTAAISAAGGCGVLTAAAYSTEDKFKSALEYIKQTTPNPFAINMSAFRPIKPNHKYYKYMEIAKEGNIKAIITAGSRIEHLGKKIQENGLSWIHKGTTMKHAVSGEKVGADAIILTGLEAVSYTHLTLPTILLV